MTANREKYFGVYRGLVVANDDSKEEIPYLARIKVKVPVVHGDIDDEDLLPWAWPCMNFLGGPPYEVEDGETVQYGQVAIPPVGATVWIMFEQGNPMSPIYIGMWFNNDQAMPQEAREPTSMYEGTVAKYPNVILIKSPWRKDVFIRFNENHSIEIRYGEDIIMMKGPTEDEGDDGKVYVKTVKSNIELWITDKETGKIQLWASEIEILARKQLKIQSGEWEDDGKGGTKVKTEGNMQITCSKDMQVFGEGKNRQQSGKEGAWICSAAETSGYEKHPQ